MTRSHPLFAVTVCGCLSALLIGCAPSDANPSAPSVDEMLAAAPNSGGMPAGAIPLSDSLYAVPVAVNADGCEQFAAWSTSGVARQVIYFHDGSGGFTATKSEAHACNAEMVQTGTDERGCATFRAEQPDGEVTGVVYYRTQNGYTANPDNAVCGG